MLAFINSILFLLIDPGVALAAALPVMVGLGAALAMGIALGKAFESIARQPEAEGKIRGALMIGLAFIETTAIYGLFISLMILIL